MFFSLVLPLVYLPGALRQGDRKLPGFSRPGELHEGATSFYEWNEEVK